MRALLTNHRHRKERIAENVFQLDGARCRYRRLIETIRINGVAMSLPDCGARRSNSNFFLKAAAEADRLIDSR
jgi:hypothetical protein